MNLKRSLMISGVIAVVLVAGAGYYEYVVVPGEKAPPTAAELQAWQYPVEQITTNLAGGSTIQVQFTVQAPNAAINAELQDMSSQVDDAVIGVLHNLSSYTIMQHGGYTILRADVAKKINALLPNGKIDTVYIDSLIVQ